LRDISKNGKNKNKDKEERASSRSVEMEEVEEFKMEDKMPVENKTKMIVFLLSINSRIVS
jgi:hypothetical protein